MTVVPVSVFLLEERGGNTSLVPPKKDFFFGIQETGDFLGFSEELECVYIYF